ncbi:PAS domain S-box protein [Bacillus sp. V3B]|uniref:PAS domain S-box protein n=1 Tax=Bacillus sp. V3B TaxID=2804915 RepID=UPI00210E7B79|nr:PAS domain S-box protein [Bacillus sp. V3B]MCQ6276964.1 PAS domain S-box protein [Bacillus sp. V3B]
MNLLLNDTSIEIYKSIMEYSSDAIFILSVDGEVMEVNQAITKLYGYSKEEMQGKYYQDTIVPDHLESTNQYFAQALQGTPCEYETQAFHKSGEIVYLLVKNMPLMVSGEIVGIFGVAIDKTELYKTKASLIKMEERFKAVFDSTTDAIDLLDLDGNVIELNPAFEELYGWKRDEVIGKPLCTVPHDLVPQYKDMIVRVKKGEKINGIETTRIKKDRNTIEVSVTLSVIRDENGNIVGTSSIARDITKQKHLEASLKESKGRYRKLVEMSPEPIVVHTEGIMRYVNKAGVKVFGIKSPKELIGKPVLNFVHPDYREKVVERMKNLKTEGNIIDLMEEKIIRFDGSIIDVEVTGVGVIYKGKPSAQLILRDITARKRAEEALRQNEEKYRLIAENMTDLVAIMDINGMVNYASPSHEFVLGYAPEVYEGNHGFDLIHPDDLPNVQSQFIEMLLSKGEKVIEFRFKHVKDNWVWVEAKGKPILDGDGNLLHFLIVARDIMERKMYREKLIHMAYHDTLTGLPNRRLFNERLEQSLKEAVRYNRNMAVIYMDMDKFKHINDNLGHDVGDELLKHFAQRVKGCLRVNDTLARQGGDEFTILLPEIQGEQDVLQIVNRILASLQEPWKIREHVFKTTSSIGVAVYPANGTTSHELMKNADIALYKAKEDGRNNYKMYSLVS